MASIKKRKTPVVYLTGAWQAYEGPGLLVGMAVDYSGSSSGCVLTAYDAISGITSGFSPFTVTSDTDFGTTVPVTCYTDGDLVAGTSTGNVKAGIPFSRGLCFNKTGDTTHQVDITLLIRPLIKKTVQVTTAGSAGSASGSASVFSGPGIMHGWRIKADTLTPSTADITIKDSPIAGSGNTIMTKTNYGYAAETVRATVTTTGTDEGGTAVTTAATGAYASPGLLFLTGLNVNVAQANAQDAAYHFSFLIDA